MSTSTSTKRFGRLATAAALALFTIALVLAGCNGSNGTPAGTPPVDNAQTAPPATTPTDQFGEIAETPPIGPPRISFDALSHDFGTMSETDTGATTFTFTNTGGTALLIEEVKPTCGCTAVTISRMSLSPGQSGQIDVRLSPPSAGELNKLIYVASNDPTQPRVSLSVKADVEAFVTLEPEHINLGTLMPGSSRSSYVSVLSQDADMRVVDVSAEHPNVEVRIVQASSAEATVPTVGMPGQALVEVTVNDQAEWGRLFSWINITVEGTPPGKSSPVRYTRQTRVSAQIFGDLIAEPDTFRAGAKPGEAFTRTIRLTRASGQPFRIHNATISNVQSPQTMARANVQINKVTESAYDLVLSAAAGQAVGGFTADVNLETDVPGLESIVIKIAGRVIGPAG